VLGVLFLNDLSLLRSLEALVNLFLSLLHEFWILKTLGFVVLVGSIMTLLERSGGIEAFVDDLQKQSDFFNSSRSALILSYIVGVFIFIESSITSMIAGAVGKPLCHKHKVPAAKLAFVCDSTSAPISSLIVLNGWGALLLGLISTQIEQGTLKGDGVAILIDAVLYNFYAMSALVVTFVAIWFKIDIGFMRYAKYTPRSLETPHRAKTKSIYMLVPVLSMIVFVFVFLYTTGDGDILKGSGSSSIFYTMLATLVVMFLLYIPSSLLTTQEYFKSVFLGAKKFVGIALILLSAFAIGDVTGELKTGLYLASLVNEHLHPYLLAGVIFLLSSLISFSTGTSWGTFSIMIPVSVPMAVSMDANVALAIGAVMSGGVFGDHCSPISDTTIISSMAAECDVVEHVKTQLPYALLSGFIAFVAFLLFSIF
jgi:Na+/H+ antiporter NhaC